MIIALLLPWHQARRFTNNSLTYLYIWQKLHVINGLRANILIGNNLLGPEGVFINIAAKTAYIKSCGITVLLNVCQEGLFIWRKILV